MDADGSRAPIKRDGSSTFGCALGLALPLPQSCMYFSKSQILNLLNSTNHNLSMQN